MYIYKYIMFPFLIKHIYYYFQANEEIMFENYKKDKFKITNYGGMNQNNGNYNNNRKKKQNPMYQKKLIPNPQKQPYEYRDLDDPSNRIAVAEHAIKPVVINYHDI